MTSADMIGFLKRATVAGFEHPEIRLTLDKGVLTLSTKVQMGDRIVDWSHRVTLEAVETSRVDELGLALARSGGKPKREDGR